MFQKANKEKSKARVCLVGPSGSGKTYSALRVGCELARLTGDGKVALLDTEHGSASKYADLFSFDVAKLTDDYHPNKFVEAIHNAESAGYDVLIIDSLSAEWNGPGGVLQLVEAASRRGGNSFTSWGQINPLHDNLTNTILAADMHVIVTLRAKIKFSHDRNEKGKTEIKKLGMGPIARDGSSYDYDVVCDLDQDNFLCVTKTRCPALKGLVVKEAGEGFAKTLADWLQDGASTDWTEEERITFLDDLNEIDIGVSLTQVDSFCRSIGKDKPAKMDAETRTKLLKFLGTKNGSGKITEYLNIP